MCVCVCVCVCAYIYTYSQLRLYRGRLLRETGCSTVTTMAPIFPHN